MSDLTFNVVYEEAGQGWVYAHVPELPEVPPKARTFKKPEIWSATPFD
jgi:hypothetical protein